MSVHGTQAVDRAFDILDLVGRRRRMSLADISNETGLTVPTAHRLVKSLTRRGFVSYNEETKEYSLGSEIVLMAAGMLLGNNLVELARLPLFKLNEFCGETVSLFGIGTKDLLCIAEAESDQRLRYNTGVGRTMPLLQGAPGKSALAWLEETRLDFIAEQAELSRDARQKLEAELKTIRENGYATSFGEVVADTTALSVPIFDVSRHPMGVISIAGPAQRWTVEKMNSILPELLSTSAGITERLGGGKRSAEK
jgi:DNA-binding IclR family transcriptional regulator